MLSKSPGALLIILLAIIAALIAGMYLEATLLKAHVVFAPVSQGLAASGRVTVQSGNTLTFDTGTGLQTITLSPSTRITAQIEQVKSPADLTVGTLVSVLSFPNGNQLVQIVSPTQ